MLIMKCGRWIFLALSVASATLRADAVGFPGAGGDAPGASSSGGFLTAQTFPQTFGDLSFVERMQVLKEGYEPYEIEFDAQGRCVSGCAFQGMKLEDTEAYYQREADEARVRADIIRAQHPEWAVPTQSAPVPAQPVRQNASAQPPPQRSGDVCAISHERQEKINPAQTVPYGYPMNAPKTVNSNYGPRRVANGSAIHMGVDLRAADGTPVFSTISGVVENVTYNPGGACGKHVKIKGSDGFAVRFCHLQEILVKKGEKVSAGCMVAKSGHSGIGKAGQPYPAHLHYEIFNQNDRQIPPEPYI
jgi:murein DD-endopeptidase MepM/ murein hydrolase activator NlpD